MMRRLRRAGEDRSPREELVNVQRSSQAPRWRGACLDWPFVFAPGFGSPGLQLISCNVTSPTRTHEYLLYILRADTLSWQWERGSRGAHINSLGSTQSSDIIKRELWQPVSGPAVRLVDG